VRTSSLLMLGLLVGAVRGPSWAAIPAPAVTGHQIRFVVTSGQACRPAAGMMGSEGVIDSLSAVTPDVTSQLREAEQDPRRQGIQNVVALLSRYSNYAIAW